MLIWWGTEEHFFSHPIILPQILIMYILWNVHLVHKILQEKWIKSKKRIKWESVLILKQICIAAMDWIVSTLDSQCDGGRNTFGRYAIWHGVLMVVCHDGISLSLFFFLILPLLPSLFAPHVRTKQEEKDLMQVKNISIGNSTAHHLDVA